MSPLYCFHLTTGSFLSNLHVYIHFFLHLNFIKIMNQKGWYSLCFVNTNLQVVLYSQPICALSQLLNPLQKPSMSKSIPESTWNLYTNLSVLKLLPDFTFESTLESIYLHLTPCVNPHQNPSAREYTMESMLESTTEVHMHLNSLLNPWQMHLIQSLNPY